MAEQEKIDKIKTYHSDPVNERNSTFQAFAAKCSSLTEVKRAYVKMKQTFPEAPHILAAYQIKNGNGYQDDKEHGASVKMLKLLVNNNIQNLVVFMVRHYEGQHIGFRRHEIIKQVVLELLASMNRGTSTPH